MGGGGDDRDGLKEEAEINPEEKVIFATVSDKLNGFLVRIKNVLCCCCPFLMIQFKFFFRPTPWAIFTALFSTLTP